jgi:hypothetical protein
VGTSGAYGGSGSSAWGRARGRLTDIDSGADESPEEAGDVAAAAQAIAQAIRRDDPTLRPSTPPGYTSSSLLPRASGGGGGGGGGGRVASSGSSGRTGSGVGRRVGRSAQRGANAIGAAWALRTGNAGALREVGLDLAELQGLGPRQQCDRILQAMLGNATHPDEFALRRAASKAVQSMILDQTPPDPLDTIREFVGDLVMEQSLVELRAQRAGGADVADIASKEGKVRRYIRARVRAIPAPVAGPMTIAEMRGLAGRILQAALRVMATGAAR